LAWTHVKKKTVVTVDTARPQRKATYRKRDLEKEMWTAGYKYSWRKMEAAAQDRAGWRRMVCGYTFHPERQGTSQVVKSKKFGVL